MNGISYGRTDLDSLSSHARRSGGLVPSSAATYSETQDVDSGLPNYRRSPRLDIISLPMGRDIKRAATLAHAGNGRLERSHYDE